MLLTADIGNTHTTIGLFRGRRLLGTRSVPTSAWRGDRGPRLGLKANEAIVCSVVPWATPKVVRAMRAAGCRRVRVVGRDIKVPLKNRYRYPWQVGQDRLVGAYAALRRYNRDCIVCDFGTAVTIDVVRKAGRPGRPVQSAIRNPQSAMEPRGEYLGGVIAPGLELSLETLAHRTALLPKVSLKAPPTLLGRDTAASIRSGIVYGAAALCDGLISRLKARYAPRAVVVATGGSAPLLARYAASLKRVRPHLVLEGLLLLSRLKVAR